MLAALLVGVASFAGACDADDGTDASAAPRWVEMRLRPPPYDEEEHSGGSARHELVWRERQGVWVRMSAEDFGHSKRETLALADDLQIVRWSGPERPQP